MPVKIDKLKQEFTEGLSQISRFWGYPKGMGAIFAVLYLSPAPLSLDHIVQQSGLTKGAVSTEIRTLARMGLVHRSARLGDRRDYYAAETNFYTSIRSILKERQNVEFDRAIRTLRSTLEKFEGGDVSGDAAEIHFMYERLRALQEFFDALDRLTNSIIKLEEFGFSSIKKILGVLK